MSFIQGVEMGKISLAIADADKEYVRRLENYLIVNYSKRFEIYSFTDAECVSAFSERYDRTTDILLLGNNIADEILHKSGFGVTITLSDNSSALSDKNGAVIYKFQHAEKIVADILSIYSQKPGINKSQTGNKRTVIAAVFSPTGGCGKTIIAVGSSMLCSERGLKTFYLNMESSPTTMFYFKGSSGQNFSNVIYYLKEKDRNISLRLEGARSVDPQSGVHYFLPPDNPAEINELLPDEVIQLVESLRSLSVYDNVFIDMSGCLDKNSIALLKAADIILEVCGSDAVSRYKAEVFQREMEMLDRKYSLDLSERTLFVMNRCSEESPELGFADIGHMTGKQLCIKECKGIRDYRGVERLMDADPAFALGLGQLVDTIMEWESAHN